VVLCAVFQQPIGAEVLFIALMGAKHLLVGSKWKPEDQWLGTTRVQVWCIAQAAVEESRGLPFPLGRVVSCTGLLLASGHVPHAGKAFPFRAD
jgi:hypothetical protein